MKLRQLHEGVVSERLEALKIVGDVVGLIPVVGEAADLGVALLHLRDKEYLSAAFSLISMVPEIGDVVGKSLKYTKKLLGAMAKAGPKAAKYSGKAIKMIDNVVSIAAKHWPTIVKKAAEIEKLQPYIEKMTNALKEFSDQMGMTKAQLEQTAQTA